MIEASYLEERTVVQPTGCVTWTKGLNRGYARARVNGSMKYVHRVLWEQRNGPVPEGHDLDHLCHTWDTACEGGVECKHRSCVNIDHLELVTHQENHHRGRQRDRNWEKTHCPQGHPYDSKNTQWYTNTHGNPARQCKACKLVQQRVRRSRA